MLSPYVCENCGFWQKRPAEPVACPVCEDYRHPLPPGGYAFATPAQVDARQAVSWDEPLPGVTRFTTTPSIGIGSSGYLIETPGGNAHFDGCGWYDEAALDHLQARGGVAFLAASHAHVYGGLWRVADRFEPRAVFQAEALPWCQAFSVTLPFDEAWELAPGFALHRTAGHTPDHTVLHDAVNGRLYCGDALKFTFPEQGQTVGVAETISTHKAYDAHIPITHGDARRYRDLFASLDFDAVITPWEVVTSGGKAAAMALLDAQLAGDPSADPFPIPEPAPNA
ncbi:MBL fold metallo-hydrolase [Phycisphaera mikurensis]|uniref:Metallo-beta-lactamase domain-containing protein n=1 Tax=Phycisphaera mikurensis (strain NBRC 102666 / KCTC 22515 / FYK2301M01) TaxID=1142394 RepID=I0IFN0_PHYMF|nr:hypothetical protein [Phycisphaera mikurensis]MBB6440542.1 hypothetical protein [Phycisphaera mikurensis]BAM04068.1 hypothetical protein PSMK_19090 [Phycisphaera mikurensis NBRC 102666]